MAISNGAFHFITKEDQQRETSPIMFSKKTLSSSNSNASSLKDSRKRISSSDDEDLETSHLSENDLKLKLKEQKRYGRKTGELLNKLHENYEELLEKYAQAENTIDHLRFQPNILNENTPRSSSSEVGKF